MSVRQWELVMTEKDEERYLIRRVQLTGQPLPAAAALP